MTRVQAKEFLMKLGIAEPTDDDITNYLNTLNREIQGYKDKASEAETLQKQLDEINKQKMSDIEKANAERDTALKDIEALRTQMKRMEMKNNLADKGILGEVADKLVDALTGGEFDASILGDYIANREKEAIANFEKQALSNTPNPNGNKPSGSEKTEADKLAESYAKSFGENSKASEDIVNAYI